MLDLWINVSGNSPSLQHSRILEANNLGTLRDDLRVTTPPRSILQLDFEFGNGESENVAPDLRDPDSIGRGTAHSPGKGSENCSW